MRHVYPYLCQNSNIRPQEGKVSIQHTMHVTREKRRKSSKFATRKHSNGFVTETQIIWKGITRLIWNFFFFFLLQHLREVCMYALTNKCFCAHTKMGTAVWRALLTNNVASKQKQNDFWCLCMNKVIFPPSCPSSCLKDSVLSLQYSDH